jgi:hypothetical protein
MPVHKKYVWPWLLPLKKIAGHKLERIPDTSWIVSVFVTQIRGRWRLTHLAGIRQVPSIRKRNPWEPHVHADAPILPAEWAKLEISRVVDDSVRGVNENGLGEWLDPMHTFSRTRSNIEGILLVIQGLGKNS